MRGRVRRGVYKRIQCRSEECRMYPDSYLLNISSRGVVLASSPSKCVLWLATLTLLLHCCGGSYKTVVNLTLGLILHWGSYIYPGQIGLKVTKLKINNVDQISCITLEKKLVLVHGIKSKKNGV